MATKRRTLNLVPDGPTHPPVDPAGTAQSRVSSDLLKQIIGTSPIGIVTVDYDGTIRSVNQAYCHSFGYRADELIGNPFTLVYPEPERAEYLARHQAFLKGETDYTGRFSIRCGGGEVRSVRIDSVIVQDADSVPMRLVYIADTAQGVTVDRAVNTAQAFSQTVLDGLRSSLCVLDEQGTILSVNKAWRDQALPGHRRSERLREGDNYLASRMVSEACARNDHATLEFVTGIRQVLAGAVEAFEGRLPSNRPGGEGLVLVRISRMPTQGAARFIVAHDDITSVTQLQHELIRHEAFLADLTQSIPVAVFRVDVSPNGSFQIVHLSQGSEPLVNIDTAQLCRQPALLLGLLDDHDMPRMIRGLARMYQRTEPWSQEFRIRTPEGELKWIAGNASARQQEDGRVIWTGTLLDITARKAAEAKVSESELRYRTLFETVPQGIVYQDPQGRITAANPAAQRILGLTLAQLQGRDSIDPRWRSIRPDGSDLPGEEHPSMVALRTGQPVKGALIGVQTGTGQCAWLRVNAIPVFSEGRLLEVYASFEDVTEQQQLNDELRNLATTDTLTGIANRRTAIERGTIEYERIRRKPTLHCTVLALDIDHFKRINDRHGHPAGDEVLRQVANRLRRELRTTDVVARMGGEEFMVLLPDTLPEHALLLAERMRGHIAATPMTVAGKAINVTLSIGVSPIDPTDARLEDSFERADAAMYEAKHAGRNTVRFAAGPSTRQPHAEMANIAREGVRVPSQAMAGAHTSATAPGASRAAREAATGTHRALRTVPESIVKDSA